MENLFSMYAFFNLQLLSWFLLNVYFTCVIFMRVPCFTSDGQSFAIINQLSVSGPEIWLDI